MRALANVVSHGGNYLLNIGPRRTRECDFIRKTGAGKNREMARAVRICSIRK